MKKMKVMAVLAVLLVCALCFTACNTLDANKVEKAPTEHVYEAVVGTVQKSNENNPLRIMAEALQKGLLKINYSNEEIMDVSVSLYNDSTASKVALLMDLAQGGNALDVGLYASPKAFAITSKHVLEDQVYGVNIETLYEDLSDWSLWDDLGISFDEFDAQYGETLQELLDSITDTEAQTALNDVNTTYTKNLIEKLDDLVSGVEDGVVAINDKNTEGIIVTYEINTEALNDLVDYFAAWVSEYVQVVVPEATETGYVQYDTESIKNMQLECDITVVVDKKTGDLAACKMNINEAGSEADACNLECDLTQAPEQVKCVMSVNQEGCTQKMEITATTTDHNNVSEKKVIVTMSDGIETSTATIIAQYNKAGKTYNAKMTVPDIAIEIGGKLEHKNNVCVITVDKISAGDFTLNNIGLAIMGKAGETTPDAPDFTNITDLTLEDLQEIATNAQENEFINALINPFGDVAFNGE